MFLLEENILYSLIVFLLGLLMGSFLNVIIYRLPIILDRQWRKSAREYLELPGEEYPKFNLLFPPSHCPQCEKPIYPWSNIPVISYLIQKGKCSSCALPISKTYPLVELLTACAYFSIYLCFGWGVSLIAGIIFVSFIIPMIFIDAKTQLLPDCLTLPFLWVGLIFNINGTFVPLADALIGAIIGYMSLWLLFHIFKLITGKEGMGYGDFKLLAALGAWLGVSALPIIILMSSLVGLLFALIFRIGKGKAMPFGPYLAISGWIVLIFNQPLNQLINWWLTRSGFS